MKIGNLPEHDQAADDETVDEWLVNVAYKEMGADEGLLGVAMRQMARELMRIAYDKGWNDCAAEGEKRNKKRRK